MNEIEIAVFRNVFYERTDGRSICFFSVCNAVPANLRNLEVFGYVLLFIDFAEMTYAALYEAKTWCVAFF